jgi:tRNA pseudouridine38-40 synthase
LTLFDDEDIERASGPTGPLCRVRLLVAYDGTDFSGFAENPGVKTVAGQLVRSLERVTRHSIRLVCAGRTDAGVHGWGQVVHFDVSEAQAADLDALVRSVNRMCAPAIVVREASVVPPDFDARRSATARCYRYTILNRPVPDPFLARFSWHVPDPLDVSVLRLGCDALIGTHDFTSFCRKPKVPEHLDPPSMVRDVRDARWHELGDGVLRFDVEASSFCQQMVRAIVGTLVDMGRGNRTPGEMRSIIGARNRAAAAGVAPPNGLVLWEVRYERSSS